MGPHSGGKSTLLQLLAGVLMPTNDGRIFTPPHLRVLHVRFREKLWQRPLADTLFFGLLVSKQVRHVQDLSRKDKERGLAICKRLGVEASVIKLINNQLYHGTTDLTTNDDGEVLFSNTFGHFSTVPTYGLFKKTPSNPCARNMKKLHESTQAAMHLALATRFKLQLARALVTDPEVLLIHQPISFATTREAETIMQLLREFVDQRGVENDPETKFWRRPRTCVISLSQPQYFDKIDTAAIIEEGSIRELSEEEKKEHKCVFTEGEFGESGAESDRVTLTSL
jgi:energy-coupling factor transporter ATP-binding protein EcfA2